MKAHPMVAAVERADFARPYGYVCRLGSGFVEATGPATALGDLCDIECGSVEGGSPRRLVAEVAAVDEERVILIPLEQHVTVRPGAKVVARPLRDRVAVGDGFAGRVVDSLGRPLDGGHRVEADAYRRLAGQVPAPLDRSDPSRRLTTGIRAIDALLTLGHGQRVGIFSASGVGKTSLMEQLAAQVACDRCVICLVGERGREVEALWRNLSGRKDAARYTIVAATSDESAALRARAASYALCLAEHWRAKGEHVLLLVDSVTRLAMALREIGLAAGAPPTVRAYTPNVFAALPRLVERCGATRNAGSITAIMTVLSETDDVDDPIVELMKSLLDGHIILSRSLAEQGHFPAIDVPRSVSRGCERLNAADHVAVMRDVVAMLGAHEEARVMIETGVYRAGTNPIVDRAISAQDDITAFLRQAADERSGFDESLRRLKAISAGVVGHA